MNRASSESNQERYDKRYEIKLIYDGLLSDEIAFWINGHSKLFRKAYPPRQINNIYFDSIDMALRSAHRQGIYSRYKLRLRWYHDSWIIKNANLELKHKFGMLGKKESFPIKTELDLTKSTWKQIQELIHSHLPPEGRILFGPTKPVLINTYQRNYYIDASNNIRITLDNLQRTYNQNFGLKPNIIRQMPTRNNVVLEIKADQTYFREISDVLEEFPLYSRAYSKYMEGTENIA